MAFRRLGLVLVLPLLAASTPGHAKDTGLIFVSNEKSNNLIVIDPKTHQVVKDIKTSRRPRDMHFNAAHDKLYVACGDDDVIDIIDVAKLEVVGKLATGTSPETFAIDEAKRRIYVSNEEGSSLSIIDIDQNIIVQEVPTGAEPEGVAISKDGKVVYVTSEVGDLVHEVDAVGGHVTRDVVVGTRPRRFAATPDGKQLWVTTELSGEVYIIDLDTFTVGGKIEFLPPGMRKSDVTPVGLAMTKDGRTPTSRSATRPMWRWSMCRRAQSRATFWSASAPGASRCRGTKVALRRQWLWRRHHDHRREKPQGDPLHSGRPRSLGGGGHR